MNSVLLCVHPDTFPKHLQMCQCVCTCIYLICECDVNVYTHSHICRHMLKYIENGGSAC